MMTFDFCWSFQSGCPSWQLPMTPRSVWNPRPLDRSALLLTTVQRKHTLIRAKFTQVMFEKSSWKKKKKKKIVLLRVFLLSMKSLKYFTSGKLRSRSRIMNTLGSRKGSQKLVHSHRRTAPFELMTSAVPNHIGADRRIT